MNTKKQNLLDIMQNCYLDRIGYHVEQENYDYSDAIYNEFVIDGEEPDEDYEWLFVNYIVLE